MGYLDGFLVTFRKLFHGSDTGKVVTLEYPEQKRPKPVRFHGRHVLNRYEDGMEKCIGCELCAGVCPAACIYVRGADNPADDPVSPGERYGFIYEINYLRCIHCDLCVEACPTEAITESKLFEFSFTNRNDAIYTKDELLVDEDGKPRHLPWEHWAEEEDLHTSAWMRATSPSGAAAYEGRIAWAGELGYGVREPERGQVAEFPPSPGAEAEVIKAAAELWLRDHEQPGHGAAPDGGAGAAAPPTPDEAQPELTYEAHSDTSAIDATGDAQTLGGRGPAGSDDGDDGEDEAEAGA